MDKTKPVSSSNPPESKGIRTTQGYQPTGKPEVTTLLPPEGGSNVKEPKPSKKVTKKSE